VLDQRPVPAPVEGASDRPHVVRSGGPDGVEINAKRLCEVDGNRAPVPASCLKTEGTVSATAPHRADNPCSPAAPGGHSVQRRAVQARWSWDRRPTLSIEPEHQRLGRAASSCRSSHGPNDARRGDVDRVQSIATAAEQRQRHESPAIAIPVLDQRPIDRP
jgi:hypothetical protein